MKDHLMLDVERLMAPEPIEVTGAAKNTSSGEATAQPASTVHTFLAVRESMALEEEPLLQMVECRICQEEDNVKNLESPCACTGSLKYAHRACVQRWCNEKGDVTCEICHEPYEHGYTAPPRPHPDETTIDISGGWTITGTAFDLRDPRILAVAQNHIMEAEYDDYSATNASTAAFCRSAALVLMALLLLRHALTLTDEDDDDTSAMFSLFLLRAAGFLLPFYIMAWAISILQRRRQRQEAAALAALCATHARTQRGRELVMEVTQNHTQTVTGWAAMNESGKIEPFVFKRRENGVDDVTIKVQYCGMCHTDLHFIHNDWGITMYPVVPGHEITGIVTKVGTNVSGFMVGDRVGVGCIAASCLDCEHCRSSEENYCDKVTLTYNGIFWDGSVTYGGYSNMLVAHKRFVVRIPDNLPLDAAAPLLCAGITVYSPMKQHGMLQAGRRLGVVGLGGLGHVAVKFGKAFGLRVTVISTSPAKEREARESLKADDFVVSTNEKQMQAMTRSLDYVIDTVSAKHSLGPILELLKVNGKLVLVAAPDKPVELPSFPLIFGKRTVSGSMTGGMKETQEMMDLCGQHNITCDIELVSTDKINEALGRLARNDVRYRFVVDIGKNSKL